MTLGKYEKLLNDLSVIKVRSVYVRVCFIIVNSKFYSLKKNKYFILPSYIPLKFGLALCIS